MEILGHRSAVATPDVAELPPLAAVAAAYHTLV